jgi:glycosyltransferase involved in cell wall biosynthesis
MMQKRIVLLQSGLGAGGAEKIVNMIAKHRCSKGDDVHVIAIKGKPEDSFFEYPQNVKVHSMFGDEPETGSRITSSLRKIIWLRRTFQSIQPDLILSFLTKMNFLCACSLLWSKPTFLVSERNNPLRQKSGKIWRHLLKFTFARADYIVMQTNGAMSILNGSAKKKAVIIPNPSLALGQTTSTKDPTLDLVAVGRLTHQKGFDILIRALAKVKDTHPKISLTIWGEGEERDPLATLIAENNLANNISLPGNTTVPMDWVNSAKIFVLSSRYEGFPNVLAEAMSAGMPSIAVNCDWGPSDLIESGKNGLLAPLEDPNALANAITTLLDNPTRQEQFGSEAQETLKAFSESKVLDMWDNVLDKA